MIKFELPIIPPASHSQPSAIVLEPGDSADVSIGHYRNGVRITWQGTWFNRTPEKVRLEFTEWEEAEDDDATQVMQQVPAAEADD